MLGRKDSNNLNPSCRWQLGRRRLDGGETLICAYGADANESYIVQYPGCYLLFMDDGLEPFESCPAESFLQLGTLYFMSKFQ